MLYDKESFGYKVFSEQLFFRDKIRSTDYLEAAFSGSLTTKEKRLATLQYLVHAGKFTRDELCQVAGIQIIQADSLIGRMIASNILRKGEANVWEITPIGQKWLNDKLAEFPKKSKTFKHEKKTSKGNWIP